MHRIWTISLSFLRATPSVCAPSFVVFVGLDVSSLGPFGIVRILPSTCRRGVFDHVDETHFGFDYTSTRSLVAPSFLRIPPPLSIRCCDGEHARGRRSTSSAAWVASGPIVDRDLRLGPFRVGGMLPNCEVKIPTWVQASFQLPPTPGPHPPLPCFRGGRFCLTWTFRPFFWVCTLKLS